MRNHGQTDCSVWILIAVIVGGVGFAAESHSSVQPLEIAVLYDNYKLCDDCRVDWGFSCMVTGLEKTILFDAGASGGILFENMGKLQVDAHAFDLAVISHDHADHTAGLNTFLSRKGDIPVYLPRSVSSGLVQSAEGRGATVVIPEEPLALCEGAHLTGPMGGGIIEQSMILDTPRGLVVITGCAHPGVVQIVRKAKELFKREVYLVMGGFHLLNMTDAQVQQIIQQFRDLGVQKAGASHCTGPRAIELFRQAYRQDFVSIGVGKIDIPVDCDFTGDWLVDLDDLLMLIENWGQDAPRFDIAPTFGDGTVDALDLEALMAFWQQEIKNPALMAHWRLDETEGDVAFDSAAENHAAILGGATWESANGYMGGALSFDGIDDCILAPRILNPADGVFSVYTWVKGRSSGKVVISQEDGADWLLADNRGCLMSDLKSGGRRSGGPLVSDVIITDGTWHRVGLIWNGTERALYVDDVEVARDAVSGLQESNGDLYVGVGNGLESETFWAGMIDDIRIYDRVVEP